MVKSQPPVETSHRSMPHRSYLAMRVGGTISNRWMVVHTLVVGLNRRRPLHENVGVVAWFGMALVGYWECLCPGPFPIDGGRAAAVSKAAAPS